jgi:hypothetical protein
MEPKETNKCKNNVKTSIGICCKLVVDKIWYKIIRQTLILNIVTKSPRTCQCTLSVRDFYIVVTKMTPYTRIGDDILGSKVARFLWLWFQIVFCYLCYQFCHTINFFCRPPLFMLSFFFHSGMMFQLMCNPSIAHMSVWVVCWTTNLLYVICAFLNCSSIKIAKSLYGR